MSAIHPGPRLRRSTTVILLAVVAAGAACTPAPSGTAAPPFGSLDGTPREALLAYGGGLSFDTARGAGDEQPLPLRDSTGQVVPGPNVRIEPERGAAYLTRAQLGAGRIIARYRAEAAYSPLKIPSGTSYVWADSSGGAWREVIVPENPLDTIRISPMTLEIHPPGYHGPHPVYAARWIVAADSVGCNKPCSLGCCRCPTMSLAAAPTLR